MATLVHLFRSGRRPSLTPACMPAVHHTSISTMVGEFYRSGLTGVELQGPFPELTCVTVCDRVQPCLTWYCTRGE